MLIALLAVLGVHLIVRTSTSDTNNCTTERSG
jgi:hypothetical protein